MIEQINKIAEFWWSWMWPMFWQVGVLIVLLGVVDLVIRRRVWPQLRYALWLLVLVKLVLPPTFALSTSLTSQLQPLAEQVLMRQTGIGGIATVPNLERDLTTAKPLVNTSIEPSVISQETGKSDVLGSADREVGIVAPAGAVKPSWHVYVMLIWLLGALVLATWLVVKLRQLRGPHRGKADVAALPPWFGKLLADTATKLNLRRLPEVAFSETVVCPAVFGIFRPILLLPKGNITGFSRKDTEHILLHELAHIKRGDLWVHSVYMVLQVVYWFNPMLWFVRRQLRHLRELCCDATVGRILQEKTVDYRQTILENARRFLAKTVEPGMGLLGLFEDSNRLLIRLKWLEKKTWKYYHLRSATILAVVALMSACVLPMAKAKKSDKADMPVSSGADKGERIVGKSGAANATGEPARQPSFREIRIPNRIRSDAQFSPDGKKIAWGLEEKLWIRPRIGTLGPDYPGAPQLLNTGEIKVDWDGFTWSGDGRWIAFNVEGDRIYIVSAEGGKPKQVHESDRHMNIVNYRMSLSPHGKTLAFCSNDEGKLHIYTISVDGGSPKQLVDAQAREPVFSPDGKMIAYVEDKNLGVGGGGLWTVPADGGTPTLVAKAGNASSPVWSPDGRMIAFIDYGMEPQISIVPIGEDGKPTGEKVTIDCPEWVGRVKRLAGWTPDNEIGAIFQKQTEYALYTQPVQGGKATFVTHGGFPKQPRWSPDGRQIYHTNRADKASRVDEAIVGWKRNAIAHVSAEGGDVTTVPIEAKIVIWGYGAGNHVSPDGNTIVFAGRKLQESIGIQHIWTFPIEGGKPKQLTDDPQDWYPCWSPDGKAIAFLRGPTSEHLVSNIYIIPANGGEPRQLTSESDMVFSHCPIAWSPDGEMLAYFCRDEKTAPDGTLKVIPVDGGEPRVVGKVKSIYANKEMAWSPDSKQIAFNEANVIKIVSLEDGNIVDIEPDLEDTEIYHLDWSPNGERLVFAGAKGGGLEFWLMENFLPTSEGNER